MKFWGVISVVFCLIASVEAATNSTIADLIAFVEGATNITIDCNQDALVDPYINSLGSCTGDLPCKLVCGSFSTPCEIVLDPALGFEVGVIVGMVYKQAEVNDGLCAGTLCQSYTSPLVFYVVQALDADAGTARVTPRGFMPACKARCKNAESNFSGICQAKDSYCVHGTFTSQCNSLTNTHPSGTATFERYETEPGTAFGLAPGFATLAVPVMVAVLAMVA